MRWPWKRDADLERELQSDLELEEEEQRERGLPADEAHYAARRAFGNPTVIREQTRALWSWNRMERLLRDLRISARTLLRSPGYSAIAVLVMALCIGAATSLFTVVRSVLLRPLPFRDPSRLVMVYEHFRDPSMNALGFNYNAVAPADYYDWRSQTHGFADMAASRYWQFNLTGTHGELPEIVEARGGSWNLFPLLGVRAAIGRTFTASEDRPGSDAVLLTWNLFERRFGANPSIVGRQIHLDGQPLTVVGVLPKWFTWPDAGVQIWVPFAAEMPPEILAHHDFHFVQVIARLQPHVSLKSALSQVEAVQYRLHMQNLNAPVAEDVASKTLIQALAQDVEKPLIVLLCAAGCMLLIGCLNVANLMVARSAARQRETAVRSALGAPRGALIRERLMETLLIAVTGGAAGVLLSLGATHWLVSTWKDLPSAQGIHVDGVVLAFACGLVVAATLLAGLLPAISSTGRSAMAALQASPRTAAGSHARTALRRTLLTVEIAATVVLLIGAGLLLKSFWRLRSTGMGCTTENVLTMQYSLPARQYDTPAKMNAFNETLLARVRALPGVRAAALGTVVPGAGHGGDNIFTIPSHPPTAPGAALPDALTRLASPGYFKALQIPLLSGRFFTSADREGQPNVAIISRQLARQYFPGENPLGRHVTIPAFGNTDYRIVGVVGDTLYQVGQPSLPILYGSVLQTGTQLGAVTLVVRTASDPLAFAVPVQKIIAQLDSQLPVSRVFTLEQIVGKSLGNESLSASLVLAFALLSLLLASVGLYGVLSYLTTQRTSEIGVRLALGAPRDQVVRLMVSTGLRPALYGLGLGLAASLGVVRLIASMLYGTKPLDPAVFAGVAAVLLAVAALACLIPAWRASRIDPMQALRIE
ncbi:MAG TPA: ABC transporter permease [Bryobacteraceae bacterium]|nr:ABC transporter permease [Bryobacteraceae bacterium]